MELQSSTKHQCNLYEMLAHSCSNRVLIHVPQVGLNLIFCTSMCCKQVDAMPPSQVITPIGIEFNSTESAKRFATEALPITPVALEPHTSETSHVEETTPLQFVTPVSLMSPAEYSTPTAIDESPPSETSPLQVNDATTTTAPQVVTPMSMEAETRDPASSTQVPTPASIGSNKSESSLHVEQKKGSPRNTKSTVSESSVHGEAKMKAKAASRDEAKTSSSPETQQSIMQTYTKPQPKKPVPNYAKPKAPPKPN